jgi:hypothetical protein
MTMSQDAEFRNSNRKLLLRSVILGFCKFDHLERSLEIQSNYSQALWKRILSHNFSSTNIIRRNALDATLSRLSKLSQLYNTLNSLIPA